MNYVITYWVPPNTSLARQDALRNYFDLQRKTKKRIGGYQTIVTNLDYDDAIPFIEPEKFQPQHGIIAKWIGLGQMIDNGMEFPIMMHDHDVFVKSSIDHNEEAICAAFGRDDYISDQILIIPDKCKDAVIEYIDRLRQFDFKGGLRSGYGCEVRHEGRYSSEVIQVNMTPLPFVSTPKEFCIKLRDLVSFDIQNIHSLDQGNSSCNSIPENAEAVHGHLDRGSATTSLMEWLDTSG